MSCIPATSRAISSSACAAPGTRSDGIHVARPAQGARCVVSGRLDEDIRLQHETPAQGCRTVACAMRAVVDTVAHLRRALVRDGGTWHGGALRRACAGPRRDACALHAGL